MLEAFAAQPEGATAVDKLSAAIGAANQAVRDSAAQNAAYQGMGTTLVAAVLEGNKLYVGNVGDSRAYLPARFAVRPVDGRSLLHQRTRAQWHCQGRGHPQPSTLTE